MRVVTPDPLSPIIDLILRGYPVSLAWAGRWSVGWGDPVIGAWKKSRDPVAMAVLIAVVKPGEIQSVANAIWRPFLKKYVNDPEMVEQEVRAALDRNSRASPGMMRWMVDEDMANRIRYAVGSHVPTLAYVMAWNRKQA